MSTYSSTEDLEWRVSRVCENGACVQVARLDEFVLIRNTNDPEGPVSVFTKDEWRQFLAGAKLGDFDEMA
jgi:predicted secreted Zn-dependent protease